MNRFLKALGIVSLSLLAALGMALAYGAYAGSRLDASSKAFVEQAVHAISANWAPSEVLALASPQLRAALHDEDLKATLLTLSRLGQLRTFDGARGGSEMSFSSTNGRVITANYVATATFENAAAEIHMRLIQVDGHWKLLEFFFKPSLLRANA